jgi:hypothetical protein
MPHVAPREYRPTRAYATTIAATGAVGGLLLTGYSIISHTAPQGVMFAGVILTGIMIATTLIVQRQRRILDRLDKVDRQFARVRMQYVADEIDTRIND